MLWVAECSKILMRPSSLAAASSLSSLYDLEAACLLLCTSVVLLAMHVPDQLVKLLDRCKESWLHVIAPAC